jgi:hypothetical protein
MFPESSENGMLKKLTDAYQIAQKIEFIQIPPVFLRTLRKLKARQPFPNSLAQLKRLNPLTFLPIFLRPLRKLNVRKTRHFRMP